MKLKQKNILDRICPLFDNGSAQCYPAYVKAFTLDCCTSNDSNIVLMLEPKLLNGRMWLLLMGFTSDTTWRVILTISVCDQNFLCLTLLETYAFLAESVTKVKTENTPTRPQNQTTGSEIARCNSWEMHLPLFCSLSLCFYKVSYLRFQ